MSNVQLESTANSNAASRRAPLRVSGDDVVTAADSAICASKTRGWHSPTVRHCLELAIGFALGSVLIMHFLTSERKFEDLGLGDRTSAYQARDGRFLTHVIKN